MSEHDWRELLDDETVVRTIQRVYSGPGWRRYGLNPRVYDDLEPWLWDKAVDVARWYTESAWHFPKTLYVTLAKALDHYHRDSTRNTLTNAASIDAEVERYNELGTSRFLFERQLVAGDPLAAVLRLEDLEDRCARRDRPTGPTDGYCIEALCPNLASTGNMCSSHYHRWYEHWRDNTPCSVDGCENDARTAGMCETHYGRHRAAATDTPRCSWDGCDRAATRRALCQKHYDHSRNNDIPLPPAARVRSTAGVICALPDCANPVKSKGLCRKHYLREWKKGRRS